MPKQDKVLGTRFEGSKDFLSEAVWSKFVCEEHLRRPGLEDDVSVAGQVELMQLFDAFCAPEPLEVGPVVCGRCQICQGWSGASRQLSFASMPQASL